MHYISMMTLYLYLYIIFVWWDNPSHFQFLKVSMNFLFVFGCRLLHIPRLVAYSLHIAIFLAKSSRNNITLVDSCPAPTSWIMIRTRSGLNYGSNFSFLSARTLSIISICYDIKFGWQTIIIIIFLVNITIHLVW